MTALTRAYRFSASHRLHSRLLTDDENAAVFGKCNNPYGHGHDYVLSVTVTGPVDRRTGLLLPVKELNELVRTRVLDLFDHSNINVDVPHFADMVPTTENVALVVTGLLSQYWSEHVTHSGVRLHRVHVQETERNGFEVVIPATPAIKRIESEGLLVHA